MAAILTTASAAAPSRPRGRALFMLMAFCLQFSAAAPGWAQDAPGPPVAEPNLPPPAAAPPETPAEAPRAPAGESAPVPVPAPVPVAAPGTVGSPEAAAVADAEADTSSALWFGAGCLLSWVGVLVAYVVEPVPPYARIVGKPPEYVGRYVRVYTDAGRGEQTRMALFGCGTTLVAYAAVMVFALSGASNGL